MFRSYVRWREGRMANRGNRLRHEAPLEWGLDCLGLCPGAHGPLHTLEGFARDTIGASEDFFTPESPIEYSFERDHLSFPSPIETETASNNTAHARFFECKSSNRAVVIIPHWNASPKGYDQLAFALRVFGVSALRMSLPYHQLRRPTEVATADYMVSSNLGRTVRSSRQAVLEARLAINWLADRGYKRLGVVGSSIGSSIASIVAAHDERVNAACFFFLASRFGEVVWTGGATQHIRRSLEGHITLEQLNSVWSVISPVAYVRRFQDRQLAHLVITAAEDEVFRPHLSQQMLDAYRQHGLTFTRKNYQCGHYTLGVFPFKLYALRSLLRFLRECL